MTTPLKPAAIAERLGISRSSVYALRDADPTFPCYTLPGIRGLWVEANDLERWIQQRKREEKASRGLMPLGK